eukprot:Gb_02645 [translate_table: standard]
MKVVVDSLSICLNINAWEMVIPLGFLAAIGVRVANELGANNGKGEKFAVVVSATSSAIRGLIFWALILVFHSDLASLFIDNPVLRDVVYKLTILLAFAILLNSIQPVLIGVAVRSRWQTFIAYVNIVCYYIIGVPLGMLLGTWKVLAFTLLRLGSGIPYSRHSYFQGLHLLTKNGKDTYCKFHWKPTCGQKFLLDEQVVIVGDTNHNHDTKDLQDAIASGMVSVSMRTVAKFCASTLSRISTYIFVLMCRMILNKIIDNFFNENEMLSFNPGAIVPSIYYTNDKMYFGRVSILLAMYSVAMVVGATSSFVWTKGATTSGSHLGFRPSEGLTVKMVLGT